MTISKLEVVLESRPRQKYCSGENLCGRVDVRVESIMACSAILVKAVGRGEVESEYSKEEEIYMENIITVWCGSDNSGNILEGEYSFPFTFKLPDDIPSSFEGIYGHIRYSVETKAQIPWGRDVEHAAPFLIDSNYNLAHNKDAAEAVKFHKVDTICCLCCIDGPIHISLTAEKTGYIPGEFVLVTGEVVNRASVHIDSATIDIIQTIKYGTGEFAKVKCETIQTATRGRILAGETDIWLSFPIRIPDIATCLEFCKIMSATYEIKIDFHMGFCSNIDIVSPIIIGSLPVGKVTMAIEGQAVSPQTPQPSAPPLNGSQDIESQEMQPILYQPKSINDEFTKTDYPVI